MKKTVPAVMAALMLCGTASAEHAGAARYREMVDSGRYYVEYTIAIEYDTPKMQKREKKARKMTLEAFSSRGERRSLLTTGGKYGNSTAMRMQTTGSIGNIFKNATQNSMSSRGKMKLDLLRSDGKYYQFFGNKKALVMPESEAKNEHADERLHWQKVPGLLAFPRFLPPLSSLVRDRVKFTGSGTGKVLGEEMAFDSYVSEPADGDYAEPLAYKFYYDEKGSLRYVNVAQPDDDEPARAGAEKYHSSSGVVATYFCIEKFTTELPPGVMDIPAGTKIYYIEPGGMDDLFSYGRLEGVAKKEEGD